MQSVFTSSDFTLQSERPLSGLHVAIIMDGNGRWAQRRGLPRVAGHRAGVAAVRRTIEHAPDLGVSRLTLYAFSSDNWSRPAYEVQSIFTLIRAYLRLETRRMRQRGVRIEVIGRRDRLPAQLRREIERAEAETLGGRAIHVRLAVDYSSRSTIAHAAAQALAEESQSQTPSTQLSEDDVRRAMTRLLSVNRGDVDLLIRTGGEKRLSDFLLWESAYAELHFTDCMWPDFDESDLEAAVRDFHRRDRRFGAVLPQPASTTRQMESWLI